MLHSINRNFLNKLHVLQQRCADRHISFEYDREVPTPKWRLRAWLKAHKKSDAPDWLISQLTGMKLPKGWKDKSAMPPGLDWKDYGKATNVYCQDYELRGVAQEANQLGLYLDGDVIRSEVAQVPSVMQAASLMNE